MWVLVTLGVGEGSAPGAVLLFLVFEFEEAWSTSVGCVR